MGVVAYDTAAHHQNSYSLCRFNEFPEIDLPCPLTLLVLDGKDRTDIRSHASRISNHGETTDERQRLEAVVALVIEIPLLPLQRDAHGFHEVHTGPPDRYAANRSQVGQG